MNALRTVWFHPRQAARQAIETQSLLPAIGLVVVGFMASAILGFQNSGLYPNIPYMWIFLIVVIGAPLFGGIMFILNTGIAFFVGKVLGGTGEFWAIFKALSLSYIPMIVAWPLYMIWLFVSPESFFLEGTLGLIGIIGTFVMFVSSIWSFIILVGALSEAHRYSIWRAFLTLIIPSIVIFSALIALLFFVLALFTAMNM